MNKVRRFGVIIFFVLLCALPVQARDARLDAVRKALNGPSADAAVEAGESAVATLPGNADAWYYAGLAYGRKAMESNILVAARWAGKTRDAFQEAVDLEPRHFQAQYKLIGFYLMAPGVMGGGRDKAERQIARVAALDEAAGHLARSMLLSKDEDTVGTERELRAAVAKASDNARYHLSLIGFLIRQKREAEIGPLLQLALERYPNDANLLYYRGRLAAVSGQNLEAGLAALDEALTRADPLDPDGIGPGAMHWRRGQVLEKLGRRDDAIASLRHALTVAPELEEAREDLEHLRETR